MKDFIEYLLKQIVSKPEEVKIEESVDPENQFHSYRVHVSQDDMGLVIGKEGKTIKSLRNLTRAKAIKEGIRMHLELAEVEGQQETEETEVTEEPAE